MLSIRLKRMGKKKAPVYRIVVMDKTKNPGSNYLELLGFYDPRNKPKATQLKEERIKYWLGVGASSSPTVHNIFVTAKIVEKSKIKIAIKKKKKEEGPEKEETKMKEEVKIEEQKNKETEKPKNEETKEPTEQKTEEPKNQETEKPEETKKEEAVPTESKKNEEAKETETKTES